MPQVSSNPLHKHPLSLTDSKQNFLSKLGSQELLDKFSIPREKKHMMPIARTNHSSNKWVEDNRND